MKTEDKRKGPRVPAPDGFSAWIRNEEFSMDSPENHALWYALAEVSIASVPYRVKFCYCRCIYHQDAGKHYFVAILKKGRLQAITPTYSGLELRMYADSLLRIVKDIQAQAITQTVGGDYANDRS